MRLLGRRKLLTAFLSLVLAAPLAATMSIRAETARAYAADNFFTVAAEQGWQKTPFSIDPAHPWYLHQDNGTWTVDYRNLKWTDAWGYDPAYDANIYKGCKDDESQPYGYILGRVGPTLESAKLVYIGGSYSGWWFAADGSGKVAGPIWLRINDKDMCLGDNQGNIRVVFGLYE